MNKEVLLLIAKQFCIRTFKTRGVYLMISAWVVLLLYAAYSGISYTGQNHYRDHHQELARKSWEGNPDKHPHRMAHFGTFAFRLKHPLSVFDFGLESYVGNAVFLEAHKQNAVNFSEAGFSTGLLRFGELSMAVILQLILPLLIFFLGYAAVSSDRENGTLKILLTQGAGTKEILYGRSLGLFGISAILMMPFFIITTLLLVFEEHGPSADWVRLMIILLVYILYVFVLSLITVSVSSRNRSSAHSLLKLLGIWLVMMIMLPKTVQAMGSYFYPAPGKLEFKSAIEKEVIQYGDSHDPNDSHFNGLRDSVLNVYQVTSIEQLPFNYGGFVMKEGERISAIIYNKHHDRLLDQYRKQNQFLDWLAFINPYLAVKNLSMSLTDTNFESYMHFQQQAEEYRYKLAQKMNDLQIHFISPNTVSSEGKKNVVDRKEWQNFPDFHHQFLSFSQAIGNEIISLLSMIAWLILSWWILNDSVKRIKVV